jgi:autotransporter-associated beta strand protein
MWKQSISSSNQYNDPGNWTSGVPSSGDTATFGTSNVTNISLVSERDSVSGWVFQPGASQYNFEISGGTSTSVSVEDFEGTGITINGGSVRVYNFGGLFFSVNTTSSSSPGEASISNFGLLIFGSFSTAAEATINTIGAVGGIGNGTIFQGFSTGGSAQFITEAGGTVDFSQSSGPAKNHQLTAGSLAGDGIYDLGGDQLTVGSNGLSTTVSGAINDGGLGGGSGASLVKVGNGALTLSGAGNTYSGGTTLVKGALDLAAVGAAGTRIGATITFAGNATLIVENAALSGHVFGNPIDFFAKHDVLDLPGLKFHRGAAAKYHKATDLLTVRSGHVTDILTLLDPLGSHFIASSDGHGGTKVTLAAAHLHAAVASLAVHEVSTDSAGGSSHMSDFLFTA